MPRKSNRNSEQLVSYIYGLDSQGDVVAIAVYQKGKSVRLSGPNFTSHYVHPSNSGSLDGWEREIAIVWYLTDLRSVSPDLLNSETSKREIEELKQIAATRKSH